jgi:hypothetical protein
MKTIKKSIFATLILAVMGIFIARITSDVTVSELLDQNIEALAGVDPLRPSSGEVEGYTKGEKDFITPNGTVRIPCCIPMSGSVCNYDEVECISSSTL